MTSAAHTFIATAAERLDILLARALPDYSRSYLQKLCQDGAVSINGTVQTKPSHMVAGTETVVVRIPILTPPRGTLPVTYEDDDVIVVNKPAGILTHAKGALHNEFTVAQFMRSRTLDDTDSNRPGIVHRLDRDTSGVLIAAKHASAKRWLQKQFAQRRTKKTYIALVIGRPKQPAAHIDLPIERNPKKPQTFRVSPNGKSAQTTYETVHQYAQYTLLRLKPYTGRTHQLRVHMQYIGCPIVGDKLYGTPAPQLGRMFLHAAELELTLPSRERKTFSAPLAPELQKFLDSLQ